MAELPPVRIDAGYGVVAEEQLLERGQAIQGAAVHLRQTVEFQVTAGDKINTVSPIGKWDYKGPDKTLLRAT